MHRYILLASIVCAAALFALQQPVQPAAPPAAGAAQQTEPKAPAKISGRVTNTTTGEPLKRVNVVLLPAEQGPDSTPSSTTTDTEGNFAMTDIPPGKYRLSAGRTGFVRQEFGSRGKTMTGTTVSLAPGQEIKQMDMRLEPHAVITGRVTDEEGEPLAYVSVQTVTYRYMQGRRQLMPMNMGQTNDLGEYRIFGLPPGRYYLSATLRNMSMGMGSVDRSAAAQQNDGFASTYYPGTTDPAAAVQINVSAGRPVTGMDIRLHRMKTARIRGRVVNARSNFPGRTMVFLTGREGGSIQFDRDMTSVRGSDGSFELRGVTPGAYYLSVQSFDGQDRQSAKVSVDVGTENIDGLELTLTPAQDMKGIVRVEGEGLSPAAVRVYLEVKEMMPMGGGGMSVTHEDGSFTMRSVVPDTYRVRILISQGQGYLKSVSLGEQEAKNGEVTLSPGVSPILNVVVSTAAAQVAGLVKGEKDAPVQGAMVVLVPDTAKRQQQALFKNSTTDQYGRFTLTSITPGTYKLFAWDSAEFGEWMDPDFLQTWESKGLSITLKEGSKETSDLTLLKNENAAAR